MTQEEYLKNFVDDQIDWYNRKSRSNQKWYKRLRTTAIVCSILIPLFAGFIEEDLTALKYVVGALGAIVALVESILALNKYKENWLEYRATCEAMQREKRLFLMKVGRYQAAGKAFPIFVERIEKITGQENIQWIENMQQETATD